MVVSQKVAVVIPSWNGADFIRPCLNSLVTQTCRHEVIVVDNGSIDDSAAIIEKEYPDVLLIRLAKNTGFAGGVNAGIREALKRGFDFVALFNNDAAAEPLWLQTLVESASRKKDAGIVTGKFVKQSPAGVLDSTGDFYSIWGLPFPRGREESDKGQYDLPGEVFGATGGASLYRASMLKEIGLFDEDFFAYYEDVDISFRAQLSGWKVYYEPTAVAHHEVGGTSSKLGDFARYHTTKNFIFLFFKNMPSWLFIKYLPSFLCGLALMTINSLRRGQIVAVAKGLFVALIRLPAILVKRRGVQKNRRVSLSYIDSLLYRQFPPLHKNLRRLFGQS